MNTTLAIATVIFGLFAQQSFAQTTTTLSFDTIADGAAITSQYSSQGVTVLGANAITGSSFFIPAHSGTQLAFAQSGLMTFSLSIANVKTVAAYITGPADVGIYAYDASGNLLGQSILPAGAASNTLLSVTSSGAAIAKVAIHDGGASFFVDDVSFTTAAPQVPVCYANALSIYNAVAALGSSAYVCAKGASADRTRILNEIVDFDKLRVAKAGQKKLLTAMQAIQKDVKLSIKDANAKSILQQIDQLLSLINANGC